MAKYETALIDLPGPGLNDEASSGQRRSTAQKKCAAASACFHCGEPCPNESFAQPEKVFCCHGCLTVHELLAESGLSHFYDLNRHPGIRVKTQAGRDQWAYLDEPALQRRLLDFTDGRISRVTLHVPAIHCVACVWLLENLFRLHPGIGQSQVNFSKREVALSFFPEKIAFSELVALLASIGYEPALTLGELEKKGSNCTRKRQWLQVGIAGFAFGNIMLLSLPQYLGLDSFSAPLFKTLFGWISLALALPVLVYSASDYWRSAWLAARRRAVTLDVPIALGLAAIYGQSLFEIATHAGEGYCDSLTGLIFFLLCGRLFQQKTHERLAFDRDYKSFFPLSVTRRVSKSEIRDPKSEIEQRVSISELQVGDRVVIRNNEFIPADAKLTQGPAFIDYSFVTGESEPVAKGEGDYLYAGGKQTGAAIEVETIKPVSQSYLASLWAHDAFRKEREDTLNTLTNRYSRRFTFLVITIALGAAAFWLVSGDPARAAKAFTSVLIVACPCALALAAPFTLGTAQRWLARNKIFLKNALVLEDMARVNSIVFDKTGTLTMAFTNGVSFQGEPLSEAEKLLVASLARHSTHPHAARISQTLETDHSLAPVRSFVEIPGCGIEGKIGGHKVLLGSQKWLETKGARSRGSHEAENPLPHVGDCTGSRVHVAIDGICRGQFSLANPLRPGIGKVIRELGGSYELALLSGDNEKERERFRAFFGDDARLHFNQSPFDKLGFIQRLQSSGKAVMMVGDGLNDAGAFKQSDVGVAVVEDVGAFSPASDVIMEAKRVPQLTRILALARNATRVVRASFVISALYNIIGVAIAAAGLLSPIVCAVLMPVSSVSVILFACGATTLAARSALGLRRASALPPPQSEREILSALPQSEAVT